MKTIKSSLKNAIFNLLVYGIYPRIMEVVRVLKPGGKNEMVHELKFYTDIETISLLILSSRLLEANI